MSLIYVRDGADFMVVGSNFGQHHHPGWTANLLAHPDAFIEVGPERLPVTDEHSRTGNVRYRTYRAVHDETAPPL